MSFLIAELVGGATFTRMREKSKTQVNIFSRQVAEMFLFHENKSLPQWPYIEKPVWLFLAAVKGPNIYRIIRPMNFNKTIS